MHHHTTTSTSIWHLAFLCVPLRSITFPRLFHFLAFSMFQGVWTLGQFVYR